MTRQPARPPARPPASVRANVNGFLQAMQTRESADRRATARVYVEAGAGCDNNVIEAEVAQSHARVAKITAALPVVLVSEPPAGANTAVPVPGITRVASPSTQFAGPRLLENGAKAMQPVHCPLL